uniref:Cysteine proteinase inhibitor n=1 Tax=Aegilops tauschii TaxID=37682 RepID=N1R280_AEGTA
MATSTTAAISCLLLLATLSIAAAEIRHPQAPAVAGGAVGGRTEIRDVGKNKLVQSLGRFAVSEHNRRLSHGGGPVNNGDPVKVQLVFTAVAAAQKQVASGVVYYLKVIARDRAGGGGDRPFDAVVVVKAWIKSKELVSLMPSPK